MNKEEAMKWVKDHPKIDRDGEWDKNGTYEGFTVHECNGKLYKMFWYGHEGGIFLSQTDYKNNTYSPSLTRKVIRTIEIIEYEDDI